MLSHSAFAAIRGEPDHVLAPQRLQVGSEVLVVDERRPTIRAAMADLLGNAGQFAAGSAHDPRCRAHQVSAVGSPPKKGVREREHFPNAASSHRLVSTEMLSAPFLFRY